MQTPPVFRRLRAYAFDPSLDMQLDTAVLNQATFKVPWERLERGPVGEYVEVVDYDPASGRFYAPLDLNQDYLLAQDGLAPSEGNPQFHQQMVYAVSMLTIRNFEKALGRAALWSPRHRGDISSYVARLRLYPHAMREANAFYSPERKALLFGYFPASVSNPGNNLPGGVVFTCLSHDIVAHETTHALLDGIHQRFTEASNGDVLAFHEAFADIVAMLQHFTFPEALRNQIARTRGDLARQNLLGELAQQFGQAIGQYGALRSAIGQRNPETGEWEPAQPDPAAYHATTEPHARGAILVAAVFDAFLAVYKRRIADLLRIATSGSGVLGRGEIHPDLVNRLANEAADTAQHVLTMCIRALDYCPPVDLDFGDYLRALVTADSDLWPDDDRGYRIAMIEAFRRRGIYPRDVRTLSVDSLRWAAPHMDLSQFSEFAGKLKLRWDLSVDRRQIFANMRFNQRELHALLTSGEVTKQAQSDMGIALDDDAPEGIRRNQHGKPAVEVHSVRPARRIRPNGDVAVDLVVEITQKRYEPLDRSERSPGAMQPAFRGGCTLLVDLETTQVRYVISKNIRSQARLERQRQFLAAPEGQSLYALYFGAADCEGREPFAMLHRGF